MSLKNFQELDLQNGVPSEFALTAKMDSVDAYGNVVVWFSKEFVYSERNSDIT